MSTWPRLAACTGPRAVWTCAIEGLLPTGESFSPAERGVNGACLKAGPFLAEIAGDGPGYPAAPHGPGSPGCLPWSGEVSWSWCRVAAGGLVGWRVSWVRARSPGWSGVAPGLAVPPPSGRAGSLSRGAWPGGRVRVARSPALPRGARHHQNDMMFYEETLEDYYVEHSYA